MSHRVEHKAYHAYVRQYHDGRQVHAVHLQSNTPAAWTAALGLQMILERNGETVKVHRWRAPYRVPVDPQPKDMLNLDDLPW